MARTGPPGTTAALRVLYWAEGFWPYIGGIEVRSAKLLAALRSRGHEFEVITSHMGMDLPDEDLFGDIPVHRFPFWHALQPEKMDLFKRVRDRIISVKRTFEPHLVHIDFVGPSVFFHLTAAQAYPAPLLVTIQQRLPSDRNSGSETVISKTLQSADWVTSCSQASLTEIRRRVPEISGPTSVIYNGVEVPPLAPTPLPFDPPNILCVGRLVDCKGFDLALRAFAILVERFPGASLTVAGDGPEKGELEAQARDLGIAEAVQFVGWIAPDDVPALMQNATIVLVPSRLEAFGLVAAEAALMARPVVATRVGGLPEVVIDGETGLLVEPEDAGAMARQAGRLLAQPEEARRMGQAARRRSVAVFSLERHVDAYESLYLKLALEVAHARAH